MVKNPRANAGDVRDLGLIPGWESSPGEGNIVAGVVAWRIPWREESGEVQSTVSQRHD